MDSSASSQAPFFGFYGSFTPVLDSKNRVTIPSKWRHQPGAEFFVVPHHRNECLLVLPPDEFAAVKERVMHSGRPAVERREFLRQFYSRAERCAIDKQGRILLPDEYCRQIGLSGEVRLAGTGDRFEIWNADAWKGSLDAGAKTYESIADELL